MGCHIILGKKCSSAEIRVDGLVLDLDNAFTLLSQACSAKKTVRGEGKRKGETHILVTESYSRDPLKFGYNSFLGFAIFKIKL